MAGRFSVEAVFKAVDRITAPVSRMQNRVGKFTRSMERGLRSVNRVVGKMARGLASGFKRAAVVGGAALAGLGLAIKGVADKADALAKRSRRLDFPIEELQEWQFVAEQSGLSTAEFDKSIEKFAKSVGEARAGTGTLVTILKKSNPQLLEQVTSATNAAEAYDIYMEGLRGTKNQLDRTALATAAFGRTGAKFLNITEQSAEAIAALRKEQVENGVITREQAEAAEAYNDAVNSLKKSLGGFLQSVIIPMLPLLTETVRKMRAWVVANKGLVSGKVLKFGQSLVDNFEKIVKWAKWVGIGLAVFVTLSAVLKVATIAMAAFNLVMMLNPIGLVILGVVALAAALAGAAALIVANWEPIKAFFADLWGGIVSIFDAHVAHIMRIVDRVKGAVSTVTGFASDVGGDVAGFFGFGEEEQRAGATGPQMVSPQERVARSVEEQRTTSTAEVTIRDESGRAEVTGGALGPGLQLQQSGAM